MIIGVIGAIAGRVSRVRRHPHGEFIWLADVDLGGDISPVQIVFGGSRKLVRDDLVPVAPPGARAIVQYSDGFTRAKKMRTRSYRGERSHGMLCSLNELGWIHDGPNEVALLCDVTPGQSLDELPEHHRPQVALDWEDAKLMEKQAEENMKALPRWLHLDPVREFC